MAYRVFEGAYHDDDISLVAPLVVILYGSFVFNPPTLTNISLVLIQVISDGIAIMALWGLWVIVLLDVIVEKHHRSHRSVPNSFLAENIRQPMYFVTTAGEPTISSTRRCRRGCEHGNILMQHLCLMMVTRMMLDCLRQRSRDTLFARIVSMQGGEC